MCVSRLSGLLDSWTKLDAMSRCRGCPVAIATASSLSGAGSSAANLMPRFEANADIASCYETYHARRA